MKQGVRWLSELPVEVDLETFGGAWRSALVLAEHHTLTLYDAVYLELTTRRLLPLATFDKPLRRAAEAEGVALALP